MKIGKNLEQSWEKNIGRLKYFDSTVISMTREEK